jgi:predicted O-linked N-acetylglucosamine transferase (SPINDLY family)
MHAEKLVRLESGFLCYQPPADAPDIAEAPALLRGGITFGCLNTLPKISPTVIALWSKLLAAMPSSRLLLKAYGLSAASAREDLLGRFSEHGIDSRRVELVLPESSTLQHLAWYNEVDIALDTFPYNGTTTTCEALWMGVPVVTLAGRSHVSRVGASLLSSVGLPDLVATSGEEYVAKALTLAVDSARQRELRRGLRQRMKRSALLDAPRFTRGLEAAYFKMWAEFAR